MTEVAEDVVSADDVVVVDVGVVHQAGNHHTDLLMSS